MDPLRLIVFDRSCVGRKGNGLSPVWFVGSRVWTLLGRAEGWRGVGSWDEALGWLVGHGGDRPIASVQYWGHGHRGRALVDRDVFDARCLAPGHRHARDIDALRERLLPDATWWFRTCDTFGAERGQDFARRLADRLGCAVAGHTYLIGPFQSGLHRLRPGAAPHWSTAEGVAKGTPADPTGSSWSWPWRERTVSCFADRVPPGW